MADLIGRVAGIAREEPAERQRAKLEALLRPVTDRVEEVMPLFSDLLALPPDGGRPPRAISPQRQKELTFQALLQHVAGLAARQPVLALYEDVHWADPATLELLGFAMDRVRSLPVLAVITFRPEFEPPWTGVAHASQLTLDRLGRRELATMVDHVTRGRALPPEILEQILARADGVPLFVEELTKAVLESGVLGKQGRGYVLTGPLPAPAIPATLYDLLLARLDRPAPVKEVAQIAAVIGREFEHELLAAVAAMDDGRLQDALQQLAGAELLFRHGVPPSASYTFKHALVQDAAYASLLRERRQRIHGRVAAVLEERFPGRVAAEPELVARHWSEAGLVEKAAHYWHRAGEAALGRSAAAEALDHVCKGLDLLPELPDEVDRACLGIDLQATLGDALAGLGRPGASTTSGSVRRRAGSVDSSP
jgi:predicted ATPase